VTNNQRSANPFSRHQSDVSFSVAVWSKITIGSLVIAPEDDHQDGWWEAIVVDKHGNTLTSRWRDYPKLALITRKRKDVALLHPKASV
jgi:hypothetical protein